MDDVLVSAQPQERFFEGFRSAWHNPDFRRVWASFSLFFLAVVLNAVLAVHFYTWYVRIADSGAVARLQTAFYLGALVGVLGWLWAGHRREKRPMYAGAVVGTAACTMGATLLFGDGHLFGTGNMTALTAGHAIAGMFASAVWVCPARCWRTWPTRTRSPAGSEREGLFFDLLNFGEKIAAGVALLGGGALLQFYAGVSGDVAPDATATWRLGVSFGFVPAAVLVVSAAAVAGYQLNRARVDGVQRQLRRTVAA